MNEYGREELCVLCKYNSKIIVQHKRNALKLYMRFFLQICFFLLNFVCCLGSLPFVQ